MPHSAEVAGPSDCDSLLPIGAFSRRVGVSPELLRVWERRYGLLSPARTSNGRRLYSARDEQRVKEMSRGLARGLRAREAARRACRAGDDAGTATELEEVTRRLWRMVTTFDGPGAEAQLDRLFGGYGVEPALSGVILPFLREVGERWACGEVGVGHEHFAATLVQARLLGLARGWDGGNGPPALLACPPGERHTLGLLCFGLSLRSRGWRITYLGADTPIDAVGEVADAVKPARIVLSSVSPDVYESAREPLTDLAGRHRVALAGQGADEAFAEMLGAAALTGDAVLEAAALA